MVGLESSMDQAEAAKKTKQPKVALSASMSLISIGLFIMISRMLKNLIG